MITHHDYPYRCLAQAREAHRSQESIPFFYIGIAWKDFSGVHPRVCPRAADKSSRESFASKPMRGRGYRKPRLQKENWSLEVMLQTVWPLPQKRRSEIRNRISLLKNLN